MRAYFALDGSYGDADYLIIVDTSMWTQADWDEVENATDDQRRSVVQSISDHYQTKGVY